VNNSLFLNTQEEALADDSTRVTVYGVGYGEGPLWNTIYDVGVQTTLFSLREFRRRLESGPVNWGGP
jgi:hypothetical protein